MPHRDFQQRPRADLLVKDVQKDCPFSPVQHRFPHESIVSFGNIRGSLAFILEPAFEYALLADCIEYILEAFPLIAEQYVYVQRKPAEIIQQKHKRRPAFEYEVEAFNGKLFEQRQRHYALLDYSGIVLLVGFHNRIQPLSGSGVLCDHMLSPSCSISLLTSSSLPRRLAYLLIVLRLTS